VPRARKPWTKTVEVSGVAVRLYERGGAIYREVRGRDADGNPVKDRKSMGHGDRALAELQARALAASVADLRHAGAVGRLTLGQAIALYREHRLPELSASRRVHVEQHAAFFLAHFGREFPLEDLSQSHVDAFARARRTGQLRAKNRGDGAVTVRDGTVRQNLNWLAALLRWARGFKRDGRRLLTVNPLEGVTLPQEKNVRRPIASEVRYQRTLATADAVDPSGRLRCLLGLVRYTGRRLNACCQLRASDVLRSRDAVARALAAAGLDERQADHMPHGAIRWRPEHDKQGFAELTAISAPARAALDAYLRDNPRVGDVPLFPGRTDPAAPLKKADAEYLLTRAEAAAALPKLERGLFHPYRRLWASERKHLPDPDVAKAGGWRDLAVMKAAYQQADAATVLRVVENAPGTIGGALGEPANPPAGHNADTPTPQRLGAATT
jgi:hypothetical protein